MHLSHPFSPKARRLSCLTAAVLAAVAFPGRTRAASPEPPATPEVGARAPGLPLFFVPNLGQSPPAVRFQARTLGGAVFFTQREVVLALPRPERPGPAGKASIAGDPREATLGAERGVPVQFVRVRFVGASTSPQVEGKTRLRGVIHERKGRDRSAWRSNVPAFGEVVYRDLYEGVDLRYAESGGRLKATYTVAPGVDPSVIRWRYDGAGQARVDTAGNLRVALARASTTAAAAGELTEHTPSAWQDVAGQRQPVDIRYAVAADGSIGFSLPNGYDRARPLTLDPTLTYSTLLGGGGDDNGYDVAVDAAGLMYVVGRTLSVDFPTKNAVDPGCGTDGNCDGFAFYDAFVAKLDPSASGAASLLFSTYLGGSANDFGLRVRTRAVTGGPQIYVVGIARAGFPTTLNAYDQTYGGAPGADAFLTVLSGDGSQLVYSTYLGGSNGDGAWGLDVDAGGVASIAGQTFSTDFPAVGAYDAACGSDGTCDTDQSDAFVARINPGVAGSAGLLYSTYLGGRGTDQAYGVMRDSLGRIHVAGRTPSTDFPITLSAAQSANGVPGAARTGTCFAFEIECDAFVSVLDPGTGPAGLVYSTYVGGSAYEDAYSLVVDAGGNTDVVGTTFSSNFPTTASAFQTSFGGTNDAYLARLAPSASGPASLPYSTFLGGSDDDQGYGLARNGAVAHVAGFTRSTDFPTAGSPFQPANGGYWDVFVLKLNPTVAGSAGLTYGTYLGGLATDAAYGIAVEASGAMAVVGQAFSANFPVANAYQDLPVSGSEVFVARIDNAATSADLLVTQTDAPDPVAVFGEITYTVLVANAGPDNATGVRLADVLSPGASLVSFTPSQGACGQDFSTFDNDIGCDLGSLASGANATVTVVAMPFSEGTVVNTARVSSNLSDPNASGNVSEESTAVVTLSLSISDVTVVEGNSGTTNAVFAVSLSGEPTSTITVSYGTAPGTATATTDYTTTSGTLTFEPGQPTSQNVSVPVLGDTRNEPNETFTLNLSNPVGAAISDGTGLGTINNDDPLPSLVIGNATLKEGNAGPTNMVFTITLSPASGQTVTVSYGTSPGTASAGVDYTTSSGIATFLEGDTTKSVMVPVLGDTLNERPETFTVGLSGASGATIGTGTGVGTIRDDEDKIIQFDGDTLSDLTVFHAATGLWYMRNSTNGAVSSVGFGGSGDTLVPGDYDGDGITDLGIYHPPSGLWYVRNSTTLSTTVVGFGGSAYAPVRGDFDGDGKTDIAVFHAGTGLWFIKNSSTGSVSTIGYGGSGYVPVPGDYDGDGKTDLAVYHPPTGLWFTRASSTLVTTTTGFGGPGYDPVRGDFDGDGKTDLAVFHPSSGLWYLRYSATSTVAAIGYGGSGYGPTPGKYDADGKSDLAVYHEPTGRWFLRSSLGGSSTTVGFGGPGYVPVN
jgi:uncharacterized repeat protein (TIGR01451 family)